MREGRQRSAVISTPPKITTTTLLVIKANYWEEYAAGLLRGKVPDVQLANTKYPIAAILGVNKTQDTFTIKDQTYPLANFFWASGSAVNKIVQSYFRNSIRFSVDPPYKAAHLKGDIGVAEIHKVICLGKANSDGHYTRVIEDHAYIARPIYCEIVELNHVYSDAYPLPYIPSSSSSEGIATMHLKFVYEECTKTSYELDKNEKPEGVRESKVTYSEKQVREALKAEKKVFV